MEVEENRMFQKHKNINYLWPNYEDKKESEMTLDHEKNEYLLCRYLLAIMEDKYRGIGHLELLYLMLRFLITMNDYFEDGFNIIHKIIMYGNILLLEECFKIGLNITVNTSPTNKYLPGKFCFNSGDLSSAHSAHRQSSDARAPPGLQSEYQREGPVR